MMLITVNCFRCGKEKEFPNWYIKKCRKEGRQNFFCSLKCTGLYYGKHRKGKSYTQFFGKAKAEKIQKKQSDFRGGKKIVTIKCAWCGKDKDYFKHRIEWARRAGWKNFFCCSEHASKWACANVTRGKTLEERVGKKRAEEIGSKISKSKQGTSYPERTGKAKSGGTKKWWQDVEYRKRMEPTLQKMWASIDKRPTKPEKILIDHIKQYKLPYRYTGDGKFWITIEGVHINPDFVNVNCKKQYVELLGCFWHECPRCYPKGVKYSKAKKRVDKHVRSDKVKQRLFKKYGYTVTYIWEHEVHNGEFAKKLSN